MVVLCQNCQQREANVQITKTVNGETHELFLCDQCAKKAQEVNMVFHPGIIPEFLQALFGFTSVPQSPKEETCPQCGRTFSQITQASKLGCSACYQKFGPQLEPLLRRIHGGGQHVGKIPARQGAEIRGKVEIQKLKEKLQQLIKNEEFESAAVVRDQIHQLEQELGG
jgi:protein arginine kinase activator